MMERGNGKHRILAASDGKLIPFEEIMPDIMPFEGRTAFGIRLFGGTLYAPADGILLECGSGTFTLYCGARTKLILAFYRTDGRFLGEREIALMPLVEVGAPIRAGQVLAQVSFSGVSVREVLLVTHVETDRTLRFCRPVSLLCGGKTPILILTPSS